MSLDCYCGKRVLITGHTGFKGSWLAKILTDCGACVCGIALAPVDENNSLYELCDLDNKLESHITDIRNYEEIKKIFDTFLPEYVFHLAAQAIVRTSYVMPRETYDINVMGTVNVLECIRHCESVKSAVIVTTDKVYYNDDKIQSFKETDELKGYDPYSNSKSCADLVTYTYKNCFLKTKKVAVSVVRAGNVIGGGDFATDRLLPDCVRAVMTGERLILRNPGAVRPFQHVLEAVTAYLFIAEKQMLQPCLAGYYNIGPNMEECMNVGDMTGLFAEEWESLIQTQKPNDKFQSLKYGYEKKTDEFREAGFLSLDNSLVKETFGISPVWDGRTAVQKTVEWSWDYVRGIDVVPVMERQICEYLEQSSMKKQ